MRLIIALLAFMPLSLAADIVLPDTAKTITVQGLCSNWKAWRTPERNLWVGCGTAAPPSGSVELRAYYVLPK